MKKTLFSIAVAFALTLLIAPDTDACTSAIISGKLTPDGRPLIWKHRDTGELNNRVDYIKGPKYSFIAVVNANQGDGSAWMGVNEAGFAIINTASTPMHKYPEDSIGREGEVMYEALGTCRNMADFEKFLNNRKKQPRGVETNFGIIDAEGNAAYYETNSYDYYKFDVNDITVAPKGYIVYTNYSFNGKVNGGGGYIRYANADGKILGRYLDQGGITPRWIFDNLSRSYCNPLLGIDLTKDTSLTPNGWFPDCDFIPRRSTASTVVIKGVKPGENPLLSVMWTILGYPPVSVAVPLFVAMGEDQPSFVKRNGDDDPHCAISDAAMARRSKVFSLNRGSGKNYMFFKAVYNEEGKGYMQRLAPIDAKVFCKFNKVIDKYYEAGSIDRSEIANLYNTVDFGLEVK